MSTFTGWNTGLLLCLDKRKAEPVNTATGLWGIGVLSSVRGDRRKVLKVPQAFPAVFLVPVLMFIGVGVSQVLSLILA